MQTPSHLSCAEALAPVIKRWQEADEDRPKVLRALVDLYGEEFWTVLPSRLKGRVMYYLEKTGWERPASQKPALTDLDRAIAFFKTGPWRRLSEDTKLLMLREYAN